MSVKKDSKWPAVIVLSLLAIFAIGYFVLPRYISDNKDKNLQLAVTKEKITKTQQKITDLTYLKDQFSSNKNEVDQLNLALANSNLADIITSLQEIAKETGIEISDIKPTSKDKTSNSASTLSATVKGYYDGLKAFFTKLNSNIQPVSINEITLTQTGTDIKQGLLSANLSINVFQADQAKNQSTQSANKGE